MLFVINFSSVLNKPPHTSQHWPEPVFGQVAALRGKVCPAATHHEFSTPRICCAVRQPMHRQTSDGLSVFFPLSQHHITCSANLTAGLSSLHLTNTPRVYKTLCLPLYPRVSLLRKDGNDSRQAFSASAPVLLEGCLIRQTRAHDQDRGRHVNIGLL